MPAKARRKTARPKPSPKSRQRPLVVSVVGARPQFVKLQPLIAELDARFRSRIVHSGQHYDFGLSGAFFGPKRLRAPDAHLEVGSGSNAAMTARVAERFDAWLARQRRAADAVLVFGDTNTTLGAALAAHCRNVPVGHVEAGLRSFVDTMPEERNRVLTDRLATWLFCPTETAAASLNAENVPGRIVGVGDLMYEPFRKWRSVASDGVSEALPATLGRDGRGYYLLTCHRAEATDNPTNLRSLCNLIAALDRPTVFPVHPRTEKAMRQNRLWTKLKQMRHLYLMPPVDHDDLLALAAGARAVLTDSGGLQKEAYWLGVRCLILRDETEWVELVDCGANTLVGLSAERAKRALRRSPVVKPHGDRYFARRNVSAAIARRLARDLSG